MTAAGVAAIPPSAIDPTRIHSAGAFGQFEMEAAAAAIVAYAQEVGSTSWGPFPLGQLSDFAYERRKLPWSHRRRLPGDPEGFVMDLQQLIENGWAVVEARQVRVTDEFVARCHKAAAQ